jgi:hypothetical protein
VQTMLPSSLTGWGISSLDEDADGLALLTAHLQSSYQSEARSSAPAVTLGRGAAGFGRIYIDIAELSMSGTASAQQHIADTLEVS